MDVHDITSCLLSNEVDTELDKLGVGWGVWVVIKRCGGRVVMEATAPEVPCWRSGREGR